MLNLVTACSVKIIAVNLALGANLFAVAGAIETAET